MTMRVVKIGGAEISDTMWLARFASAVANGDSTVVVHGGGTRISEAQSRLGVPVEKRDGIRLTTPAVADVVKQVLCGPVRDAIVHALEAAGLKPVGIAGYDGLFRVDLVDELRLGRVGKVVAVDSQRLLDLVTTGHVPVVAPVSVGADGGIVNVNADDAASAVARAINADELLFISDVPGVMKAGQVVPRLSARKLSELIRDGVVTDGMVAKLRAAQESGVPRVRIGDVDMLASNSGGTLLTLNVAAVV